ncbi:MFS transporter [Jannaschia aquimarina]|uniref:Vacuole effluxer Atg22 like protein n=1 Tax=Jannaschia aquimarina TaxID=935700 RepID=A0A0D1CHM8_9RHOB|nr:MFS transporter [Jannaschia aquimarina]KIT14202.1 Vacuole effluxer Atg22 like protein [Jannaschia aquimarina]SNS48045.1 MFS transporter, UMF1 family [Jannaschia aquimarina]
MTDVTGPVRATAEQRRRIRGWMMFDWASQPFYTLCLTFIFGPYFTGVLADALIGELGEQAADARAQSIWSWTQTGIGVSIALTAPLLGALADRSGRRMPWIVTFSVLYVVGIAGLWFMAPDASGFWLAVGGFAFAMIGAEYTTIFTNAMLPDLAPREELGRIGGTGYALGYAGGVTALFLMLGLFADNENGRTLLGAAPALGLEGEAREGTRFVGPFSALWYVIFMVPFFLWVKDPPGSGGRATIAEAWADLKAMLASIPGRTSLMAYLAGSMLYRDALVALYAFGGVYARLVLDWETTQIGVFGIVGAITAAVSAWIGGRLDGAFGPKPVITGAVLVLTTVVILLCGMTPEALFGIPLSDRAPLSGAAAFIFGAEMGGADVIFYVLGAVIGGMGGVLQSASRTMMVRHSDPARSTEAFGLYALSGKATAFLAPMSIGIATWATGSARLGIFPIAVLFLLGLFLLRWVDPEGDC